MFRGVLQDNERHSAEDQYAFFLLASQGQLFPDSPDKNKRYLKEFDQKYDIQDGWVKGIIKGASLFARKLANRFDFDLMVDDLKVLEDQVAKTGIVGGNTADGILNIETLGGTTPAGAR